MNDQLLTTLQGKRHSRSEHAQLAKAIKLEGLWFGVYEVEETPERFIRWIAFARDRQQLATAPRLFHSVLILPHSFDYTFHQSLNTSQGDRRAELIRDEISRVNPAWAEQAEEILLAAHLAGLVTHACMLFDLHAGISSLELDELGVLEVTS